MCQQANIHLRLMTGPPFWNLWAQPLGLTQLVPCAVVPMLWPFPRTAKHNLVGRERVESVITDQKPIDGFGKAFGVQL